VTTAPTAPATPASGETPQLELTVSGVTLDPYAATPLLRFALDIADTSGREIYTIALTTRVQIDADRRAYDEETRGRLLDLFGEPDRIPQTAGVLQVAQIDMLVPSFTGKGTFELRVPVSGDLELAATRFVASLPDGALPLTLNFNGSIFYRDAADRLQVTLVSWASFATHRLPVAKWRELIDRRYAATGFVRLQAETFEALRARRIACGLPTLDAAIAEALA
jgi:hypothetical protein